MTAFFIIDSPKRHRAKRTV